MNRSSRIIIWVLRLWFIKEVDSGDPEDHRVSKHEVEWLPSA